MPSAPPPQFLSIGGFRVALELYPSLVEKVYTSKLKDPKKVADALQRDKWRFEELPANVAHMIGSRQKDVKHEKASSNVKDGGLTKNAVERLVQWKITHGHSRPFLPAMVRKNDPLAVQTQTAAAFTKLSFSDSPEPPSTSTVVASLNAACKLTGIGPATGTLILNIFDPAHIPFFQDEMYAWFLPDTKSDKLKYTQKEYLQLLEAVRPVLKRLAVNAVDLEKVSYVFGHMDQLDEEERKRLEESVATADEQEAETDLPQQEAIVKAGDPEKKGTKENVAVKKGQKRAPETEAKEDGVQQISGRRTRQKK
ncbi:ADA HAT complex component 1 [Exophiala viscosa]|uniref:ADA HAT complex component 1 n=1 Tax=Exophiala viscosa TaxID=2486360 RepID=A0AAN6IGH1_9EURO|nr:ADA HAT complex component 1 [Exophiala viscosa]KAI1629802.1 ADA HAT complex component 1 [Exophiala viscosa]